MKIIRPMTVNDAALVSSNVPETDHAAWNDISTYALADRVIVISADSHKIYESLQAGNTNNPPATSPAWWLEIGNTNRWKMFDTLVGSQTTNPDEIDVTVTADGRADSVTLLNINAATARVIVTDAVDGVIYDTTKVTTSDSGISDWYAYFYEPIIRAVDLFFGDILPYAGAEIQVIISDAGSDVACGGCIVGLSRRIGGTQYGASLSIQDYSVKTQDDFGNYTILQRAFARRGAFDVVVESSFVDALQVLLSEIRATPTVFVGSDSYGASIIYGFFKDFSIVIANRDKSICTIEIEGLT